MPKADIGGRSPFTCPRDVARFACFDRRVKSTVLLKTQNCTGSRFSNMARRVKVLPPNRIYCGCIHTVGTTVYIFTFLYYFSVGLLIERGQMITQRVPVGQ